MAFEWQYRDVEAALQAVDVAVEDTERDNPEFRDSPDVYHDMVQAIMVDCDPDTRRELGRVTDVEVPGWL